MLRIGVVAALVGGSLAITAAPALAQAPTVTITRLSSTTLNAGQSATLQYQVTNNDGGIGGGNRQVDIRVNISGNGLSCSGACGSRETIGDQDSFNATLRASNNLPAGSTQTLTISITATNNANETSQAATQQITLKGPDAPQTVRSVSGKVVNVTNGKSLADALVVMQDSANHRYDTQTNSNGEFKFTSSDSKPISPGEIDIAAGKEGFQNNQISTNVGAGQAKTGLKLTLRSTASPSASPSAEPTPTDEESAAAEATDQPSDDTGSIDPAAAGNNSDSGGGGLFSWVLIILGGLLVALGVGAIVLLVIRRKDGGEDGTGDPLPGPNGPRPTPGAQGVYRGGPEPTMVTGGAPMGGNPTMAMRPGLAEAPTMMHQPVDEYGDPYGTPLRAPQPTSGAQPGGPQPGYGYQGANQGGYGPGGSPTAPMAPGSPGAPTAYGSASPTAYGAGATGRASASASVSPGPYAPRDYTPPAQGGYGYDEPTGRYDRNGGGYGQPDQREPRPPAGPAPGGYEPDRSGYGQPANGYDPGYGQGPSNGYGQDAGYAPGAGNGYPPGGNGYEPAPPGGGYDGGRYQASPPAGYGPQGGYDGYGQQQGGYPPPYEQDGYDQPAGYERTPEPRGGYDQQRGYDQGYYDEPTTRGERGERPSRRSLDWLDD